MIESCRNCEKYASCDALCKKVLQYLEEHCSEKISVETVSETSLEKVGEEEERNDVSVLDTLRKIDPGNIYSAETDMDIRWDKNEIVYGDLTPDDFKNMRSHIEVCVPDKKIRRRFYAFLGCDTMTAIAARAGVSKQMIQQQFALIVQKVQGMMAGDRDNASISTLSDGKATNIKEPCIPPSPYQLKLHYLAVQ